MLKPIFSVTGLAFLIASCGSLSPVGLVAAARLDPLETKPSEISVAVSVPNVLRLQDGDAVLDLAFVPADSSLSDPISISIPLTVQETEEGPRATNDDDTIYVLGFEPEDAARLAQAQDEILALKNSGIDGSGSLSVGIIGACLIDDLKDELQTATWLRSDRNGQFVRLTRRTDLFDVLSETQAADLKAGFRRC